MFKREIIPFTTEQAWLANRKKDLTSTDIPSLFNVGYDSYQELFDRKLNGTEKAFNSSERIDWGTALEPAIAGEFARRNNWTIRKKSEYMRIPELRLGSSFDYETSYIENHNGEDFQGLALIEVKNVGIDSYGRDWAKGFAIEAPAKFEFQIQNELLVSGLSRCMLCVLVGGNYGVTLIREPNEKIQKAILIKCERFWKEIDEAK